MPRKGYKVPRWLVEKRTLSRMKTVKKKGIFKECRRCGVGFYEYPYFGGKRKYCSRGCSNKATARKNSLSKTGEKNPMWGKRAWNYIDGRGGKRNPDIRYWVWRRKVLNRDKNTCQDCNKRLSRRLLVAHHKKSWIKYPALRYLVSNGKTLCRPCHNKIDKAIKKHQYGKNDY